MTDTIKINDSRITINLGTKNLIKIVLAIQLAVLGAIGLNFVGIQIPIIRQLVCFIYLTFVPGILILRILKLHKLKAIETILYSVGLSLSLLMFTGSFINFFYPIIGTSKPISEIPLTITITAIVLLLCFICYLRDKDYSTSSSINTEQIVSPVVLSLLLLPFLAVVGAYLLNFYDNNILLLFLIAIISIMPILVAFNKIPKEAYPLVILISPFILLSYNTLVGNYIRTTDAVYEFYFVKLVIKNGFWNQTIPSNLNAMLGVVMLPTIFSKILNISLTWVYKIIAPLLSVFIPLGLYQAYQKRWSKEISFFAAFLFFSMFTFFTWGAVTMKMLFAGIFLMLLVLLLTDKEIEPLNRAFLSIIFSFCLITSHYGTAYIFMVCLFVAFVILSLFKIMGKSAERNLITPNFVTIYVVLALAWYMFVTSGCTFNTIVNMGHNILMTIQEFYLPESTETLLRGKWAITPQMLRILYLIVTFFMGIGLLTELYKSKYADEFFSLAIPFFGFLFFNYILVGYYGGRIWYIISIFLAPYCIAGMLNFYGLLTNLREYGKIGLGKIEYPLSQSSAIKDYVNRNQKVGFATISIFLLIFLLFNSGFASEVLFKDYGPAIYLSKERILEHGNIIEKERFYRKYITDYDVFSAKWLSKNRNSAVKRIYSDQRGGDVLYPYGDISPLTLAIRLTNHTKLINPSYVYLRYVNVCEGIMAYHTPSSVSFNTSELYPILKEKYKNKIYTNGGSEIYYR